MSIQVSETEARRQVCELGQKLLAEGLVARTWGNVSCRMDAERFVVTPSGRGYEELRPEDMVVVRIKDGSYEGKARPSSESKLHAEIYKTRPEAGGVIHTHQTNASVVAAARREVPPILDDQVQILGPSVRVAAYALPSTKKMLRSCIKALKGRNAALIANHGAITVGASLDDAFVACVVLEKACKAFIEGEFLGGAKSISVFEAHIMHQYYIRKYSKQKGNGR